MRTSITTPQRFSLKALIYSHGWSVLPPFSIDEDEMGLSVALRFPSWPAFLLSIRQSEGRLILRADPSPTKRRTEFRDLLRSTVRSMLRLDEDLTLLYRLARQHPHLRWIPKVGAGRILRASSAFEDTVKIICTTNCSWELTTLMVQRLTESLGTRLGDRYTFPTAAAMAAQPERFYRKTIRAGYRSPYLRELAQRIDDGDLDLEVLRTEKAPGYVMQEVLGSIVGVGPYATDNLLRFHGVYDYFAHDSWIRAQYSREYHQGRKVSDRTIERRYAQFGEWKGLIYWLDMTRPWYEKNFDFA